MPQAQIDTEPTHYTVPDEKVYPVTLSSRTSGWTRAGKEYLKLATPFCQCLRTIVDRSIRQVPYTKSELSQQFDLSSRLFNSAEVMGKGVYKSLEETKWLELAKAKGKYRKALGQYAQLYLQGGTAEEGVNQEERNLIARIAKWRRKVDLRQENIEKPRYFPGHEVYEKQHLLTPEEFKTQYDQARNDRIVSVGEWGEPPCCNSELQIHFEGYTTLGIFTIGYRFRLVHSKETLCIFKLARKEGEQLLERLMQNQVPYTYAPALRLVTKAEEQKKYGYPEGFIGPVVVAYDKKVREDYYIPLTLMLLRDKKNSRRWQLRISWMQPGEQPYEVGNTFLGYDLNNDSLAYTIYRLEDNQIKVLWHDEPKFESQTNDGPNRERQLHEMLNVMFDKAVEFQACVVGEGLKWEGAKSGFSHLSGLLHAIPYGFVRDAVVRKGLIRGVPIRFINPAYTSVLGGLFTQLNRDKAAALVVALKGSYQGIELLEKLCQKFIEESLPKEGIPFKVEVKHQFSEIVNVVGAHQLVPHTADGDKSPITFTYRLSTILRDVIRHRKQLHYRNRKTPKRLGSVVSLLPSGQPHGPAWIMESCAKGSECKRLS